MWWWVGVESEGWPLPQFARRKAAELEMFHCPVRGQGGAGGREKEEEEGAGEQSAAREEEVVEGERLVRGFLDAVRGLPVDTMSAVEVRSHLEQLKAELLAKKNSYVATLLGQQQ